LLVAGPSATVHFKELALSWLAPLKKSKGKFLQAAMTKPSVNHVLWIRAKIRTVHCHRVKLMNPRLATQLELDGEVIPEPNRVPLPDGGV
jgi:hypothetical protein